MKIRFPLLVLIFLAAMAASAQNIERVTDAPAWFFRPSQGEYVGVAPPMMPAETEPLQHIAAYSALVSYMLQSSISLQYNSEMQDKEFMSTGEWSRRIMSQYMITLSLPTSYVITRAAQNQYGEMFTAIRILSEAPPTTGTPKQDNSIILEMMCKVYDQQGAALPDEEYRDLYIFHIVTKAGGKETKLYSFYRELNNDKESGEAEFFITNDKNKKTVEMRYDPTRYAAIFRYSAVSTKARTFTQNDGEAWTELIPSDGSARVSHSLGMAYIEALLDAMGRTCLRDGLLKGAASTGAQQPGYTSYVRRERKATPVKEIKIVEDKLLVIFANHDK
jgi:hypothetical protein